MYSQCFLHVTSQPGAVTGPYRPAKCLHHYSGEPPSHAGSGSKQTHAVNSEPMDTSCKHWNIFSVDIQFLSMKIIGAINRNIVYILSAFDCFKCQ